MVICPEQSAYDWRDPADMIAIPFYLASLIPRMAYCLPETLLQHLEEVDSWCLLLTIRVECCGIARLLTIVDKSVELT